MAPAAKANYKTYESQARMVRAIVAAHPETKWNYKEIAECYGSDMSKDALNHRFRRLRAQAKIIQSGREQGYDMKDLDEEKNLPGTQESVDHKNIAKYFGQSTADGMQFQFRSIKQDANKLRQVVSSGGDAATCLSLGSGTGSAPMTPSKPTSVRPSASRSGTNKRSRVASIKRSSSDEDDEVDDDDGNDYDEMDTPSKNAKRPKTGVTPGQKNGTPSRRAATKAAATIAEAQNSSEEVEEIETPVSSAPVIQRDSAAHRTPTVERTTAPMPSIFGNVDQKPPTHGLDSDEFQGGVFSDNGMDPFLGSDHYANGAFYPGVNDHFDDYEI